MGKVFFRIFLWAIVLGGFFLAGDRYGAPDWLSRSIAPAFSFIEKQMERLGGAEGRDTLDLDEALLDMPSEEPPQPTPSPTTSGITDNANLRINDAGLAIIKKSEGLRLAAYSSGGKMYIGYGHQMKPGEPSSITEAQATALLRQDVKVAEEGVRKRLTKPANSNEFSAMVSLAYNLGTGAFGRSLVPQYFNDGKKQQAADAFRNHNKAGGKVVTHLTARREEERTLFLTPG